MWSAVPSLTMTVMILMKNIEDGGLWHSSVSRLTFAFGTMSALDFLHRMHRNRRSF